MRKYNIEFYYIHDLRYATVVEAKDGISAIAIATNRLEDLHHWCDNEGFEIRVRLA